MKELRAALEGAKLAPKAVVGRVSLYLRQLEAFQRQGHSTVSSSQLGEPLSIKNAQVRKDLAFFGQFGYPGIGYRIEELITALAADPGDRSRLAARAGRAGQPWPCPAQVSRISARALPHRGALRQRSRQDRPVARRPDVEPIDAMRKTVAAHKISLGLLCVPAEAAQRVADQMVACGIPGILNFAPVPLTRSPGINVVAVDLSVQLEHLAYKVQKTQAGVSCAG